MFSRKAIVASMVGFLLAGTINAATLLDNNYQMTTYVQFASSTRTSGMTFDQSGNLYLSGVDNGTIVKIDPQKNVTTFASGLNAPSHIIWGTGTVYGDFLYVNDVGNNLVYKFDANGNRTNFCSVTQPDGIGLDRVGNYGGKLFIGYDVNDHIDSLSTTGVRTLFSSFPYNHAGCTCSMAFDPGTLYGGKMYVASLSTVAPQWSGVFSLSTTGTPTRFCNNLELAGKVEFDPSGDFGNFLYAQAMETYPPDRWHIYRISPQGVATQFIQGWTITFTFFGNDMYLAEYNSTTSTTIVSKVSLLPQQGTITVANPSFEDPNLVDLNLPFTSGVQIPGWVGSPAVDSGAQYYTSGPCDVLPPDGVQCGWTGPGATLSQVTTATMRPNTLYNLKVWLYRGGEATKGDYSIDLRAGGATLATYHGAIPESWANGHSEQISMGYLATGTEPQKNQPLEIVLHTAGARTNWDNVTLEAIAPVLVRPTAFNLNVTEGAAPTVFTLTLNQAPTASVLVSVNPGSPLLDLGAGPGNAINKIFTTTNWNTPQSVSIIGVNNNLPEGHLYLPMSLMILSADPAYNHYPLPPVVVYRVDDDFPELLLSKADGAIQVYEQGTTAGSYTVGLRGSLGLFPSSDVTVALTWADPNRLSVTPATLTFTPENWYLPQSVTVQALADNLPEPYNQSITIHHASSSADALYNGLSHDLQVTIFDNTCGNWGYRATDLNRDCVVDLRDLALMAQDWLRCTIPGGTGCNNLLP